VFVADEAFLATVYLLQLLHRHVLGETAARPIVNYFCEVWRDIVSNRTFSMRNPNLNRSLILDSLKVGDSALATLANIILATESCVTANLSAELRQTILRIAQRKLESHRQTADSERESA
jgi:hypothetical protein